VLSPGVGFLYTANSKIHEPECNALNYRIKLLIGMVIASL